MKTIEIQLSNPLSTDIAPITVYAKVDSRQCYLRLPKAVSDKLRFSQHGTRDIGLEFLDDNTTPYVGPVQINKMHATSFAGAVIDGDTVTIGTMVLDDLLDEGVLMGVHSKEETIAARVVNFSEGVLANK